jgi:Kef-type K+ transport system membrane component KefB
MELLQQFGILFIIIVAIAFAVKLLKQPIIIGYVLSGLMFAHIFTGELDQFLVFFSEIGIMFLLFLMGIEFDLKSLKHLGKDVFIATIYQSVLFFGLGLGISAFLPFTWMERVHIAIAMMFSSTLFVAKWLEDKKETGTLQGRIILSTLILQDVIAVLAITILSVVQEKSIAKIAIAPLSGILLIVIAYISSKYILNYLLKLSSRYPELLFIFSLSIGFIFALIAESLGYSATIGAFLGGIVLANTIYKTEVYGRLKPLVNFFNMLFFVGLGFQMQLTGNISWLFLLLSFLIANFFIRPIVFYITLRMRGYDLKTSFTSGLYLSQISEFSIIIAVGSAASGLISPSISTIVIEMVILTMIFSSYIIKNDRKIFNCLEKYIKPVDRWFATKYSAAKDETKTIDAQFIFFGYSEFGDELMDSLMKLNKKIVVVENDPYHIELLEKKDIPYLFSSIYSQDFFEHTHFMSPELVVSNMNDVSGNLLIINQLKKDYPKVTMIVTAKNVKESLELYNGGADYVIYPAYLNDQQVSVLLQEYSADINKVITKKVQDIAKFRQKEQEQQELEKGFFQDIDAFAGEMHKNSKKGTGLREHLKSLLNIDMLFEDEEAGKEKNK